ncbi:MAG: ProQ/FINO family protein [Candidatus Accumulibacter sp.]|jgi:ProP effector|nr:ProQ/FINO family protein [Accumulibacter sp.]
MNSQPPAADPRQDARDLLKSLQDEYLVFREFKPLAIGIDKQLLAQNGGVRRQVLRLALGMHTHSFRYLKVMAKAAQRFNLDGSPGDEVPEEHRRHAADILRERREKEVERRKAEEEERKAQEAERERAEKLNRLVQKFAK